MKLPILNSLPVLFLLLKTKAKLKGCCLPPSEGLRYQPSPTWVLPRPPRSPLIPAEDSLRRQKPQPIQVPQTALLWNTHRPSAASDFLCKEKENGACLQPTLVLGIISHQIPHSFSRKPCISVHNIYQLVIPYC